MARALTLFAGMSFLFSFMIVRADEDTKPGEKPFDDADFVQKAASGGMHEVALGKIAASKARGDAVKAFAERMVTDHTKISADLKKAAAAAGLSVPETMNEKHQKEVDRFKNYKGNDFDRDYVKHMITDHESDLALFTRATKEAKNSAIKDFAVAELPTIQDHLKAVKKLQPMQ
jgi:putative membrane protein